MIINVLGKERWNIGSLVEREWAHKVQFEQRGEQGRSRQEGTAGAIAVKWEHDGPVQG